MTQFKKEQYRPYLIPNDTDLLMSTKSPEEISYLLNASDDEWMMFKMLYPQLTRPVLELQIDAWNMWGSEPRDAHYWVSKNGYIW